MFVKDHSYDAVFDFTLISGCCCWGKEIQLT